MIRYIAAASGCLIASLFAGVVGLVAAYLGTGMVTAGFYVVVFDASDLSLLLGIVLCWPVIWAMAIIFAAAAAGAPH